MAELSWQFRRSPIATRDLLAIGAAHGMTTAECVAGSGLTVAVVYSEQEVAAEQEMRVARNLIAWIGDVPGLGIETGLLYTAASLGVLGFAMLSSNTLRDAIRIGTEYLNLSSAFVRIGLAETRDAAVLMIDDSDLPDDVREFFIERDLTALARLVQFAFTVEVPLELVSTRIRLDPQRCLLFTEQTGVHATPDDSINEMVLPRALLDAPLTTADPDAMGACLERCEEILDRRRPRAGIAAAVRSLVLANPQVVPQIGSVASSLGLSERTLRRRLSEARTSYRALVDEVRDGVAVELLTTTALSVAQIAERLGYSESASFTRAFARRHDTPPGKFRR